MDKHLTETELAERLKISTRWLQKLRASGGGPAFMELGDSPKLKTIRYALADVVDYEASRKRGGDPIEPEGWRTTMKRAAACLDSVSKWQNVKPEARDTVSAIRDELRNHIGEAP